MLLETSDPIYPAQNAKTTFTLAIEPKNNNYRIKQFQSVTFH